MKFCSGQLTEGKKGLSTQLCFLFQFPESPQFHFSKFYKCNSSFETRLIAYKEAFSCCLDNAIYQHCILPCWLVNHRLGWQAEFSRQLTMAVCCKYRKYRFGCRAVLLRSAFAWGPCSVYEA